MCRLMAYYGDPLLLAQSVLYPSRSIIRQSYDARERLQDRSLPAHLGHGHLNADGFGIGWYNERSPCKKSTQDPTPCTFKGITPAWNNENLCHPFAYKRYMFMHNGVIAGFSHIRRHLVAGMSDKAYDAVQSFHSDSAVSFALFLNFLPDLDKELPPDVLLLALQQVIVFIAKTQEAHNVTSTSLLNFVLTDGSTLIATRFVSPDSDKPASLYYAEGSTFRRVDGTDEPGEGDYELEFSERGARVVIVASEPITGSKSDWVAVPKNHAMVVTRDRKHGYIDVTHTPIFAGTPSVRQSEVLACLAASNRADVSAAPQRCGAGGLRGAVLDPAASSGSSFKTSMLLNGCAPNACGHLHHGAPSGASMHQQVLETLHRHNVQKQYEARKHRKSAPDASRGKNGQIRLPPSLGYPPLPSTPPPSRTATPAVPFRPKVQSCPSHLNAPSMTPPSTAPIHGKMSSMASTPGEGASQDDSDSTGTSMHQSSSWPGSRHERPTETWAFDGNELDVEEHMLTGHSAAVMCMAQDANGLLYTSSADKTIKVWDLEKLCMVSTLTEHSKPVLKLQHSGKHLYSIGGATVRVWDRENRKCILSFLVATSNSAGAVRAICIHEDDTIYIGSQDTTLKAYRPQLASAEAVEGKTLAETIALLPGEHGDELLKTPPPAEPHEAAALPAWPSMATLATYVETPASFACSPEESHCSAINSLVCCQQYVCSASGDGTIRVWHRETLSLAGTLPGHRGPVLTLLAMGGRDNLIRVWDMDAMLCRRTLQGHTDDVLFLCGYPPAISWNGNSYGEHHFEDAFVDGDSDNGSIDNGSPSEAELAVIASCSSDGTCRLWSGCTWCCIKIFEPTVGRELKPVLCGALIRDVLALGLSDGTIWLYSIANLLQAIFDTPEEGILRASMSIPDNDGCSSALQHELVRATLETHVEGEDVEPLCGAIESANGCLATSKVVRRRASQPSLPLRPQTDPGLRKGRHPSTVTWRRPYQVKENAEMRMDVALMYCLKQFVKIKTVSGDPALMEECFRGSKFLAGLLESMGAEVKVAMSSDSIHPTVLGRIVTCASRPTILFYGHYDVQPAQELDWQTNPFKLTAKDGYLYGRGTSDNKGPILAMLFAVRELLDRNEGEECSGLPVNVGFVFEGEEEIGSMGLEEVVKEHVAWFNKPELVIISNSNWIGDVVPCITYGMRGMICLSVEVAGGTLDLHSGNEGGVINEPMSDLCHLLATLVDSHSRILIPGFYDDVDPDLLNPTLAGMRASADVEDFNVAEYAASLGVARLACGSSVEEVLTKRWCQPCMSIADVRSSTTDASTSHFGPTRFSVAPKIAQGNISIRYVPSQQAETLVEHFNRHIQHEFQKLQSVNKLTVNVKNRGQYWQADPDSTVFKLAAKAVEQEWERTALAVREGGTMPCASMLESILRAPVIMLPMGQSSDKCHLANERIRRINLIKGKNVVRRILESFAAPSARASSEAEARPDPPGAPGGAAHDAQ